MRWQTHELYLRQMLARELGIPVIGKLLFAFPAGFDVPVARKYRIFWLIGGWVRQLRTGLPEEHPVFSLLV